MICIDEQKIRQRILTSNLLRISKVPCMLIKTNETVQIYEGVDAWRLFNLETPTSTTNSNVTFANNNSNISSEMMTTTLQQTSNNHNNNTSSVSNLMQDVSQNNGRIPTSSELEKQTNLNLNEFAGRPGDDQHIRGVISKSKGLSIVEEAARLAQAQKDHSDQFQMKKFL
jgi:hypothetical protein